MFQTKVVEKTKTHILCSVIFPRKIVPFFFEIMWKNFVQPGRPQMTIWRMRIACWITKATDTHTHTHSHTHSLTHTHSEYVTLIASPLLQLLHEQS